MIWKDNLKENHNVLLPLNVRKYFFINMIFIETVESIKSIKMDMKAKHRKESDKWDSSTVGGNDRNQKFENELAKKIADEILA